MRYYRSAALLVSLAALSVIIPAAQAHPPAGAGAAKVLGDRLTLKPNDVPTLVPSLTHNSEPWTPSSTTKYARPLKATDLPAEKTIACRLRSSAELPAAPMNTSSNEP